MTFLLFWMYVIADISKNAQKFHITGSNSSNFSLSELEQAVRQCADLCRVHSHWSDWLSTERSHWGHKTSLLFIELFTAVLVAGLLLKRPRLSDRLLPGEQSEISVAHACHAAHAPGLRDSLKCVPFSTETTEIKLR